MTIETDAEIRPIFDTNLTAKFDKTSKIHYENKNSDSCTEKITVKWGCIWNYDIGGRVYLLVLISVLCIQWYFAFDSSLADMTLIVSQF